MQQRAFRSRSFNRSTNPILPVLDSFDLNAKGRRRGRGISFSRILAIVLGILLLGVLVITLIGVPGLSPLLKKYQKGKFAPDAHRFDAHGGGEELGAHGGMADNEILEARGRPRRQWQNSRDHQREFVEHHDASNHVATGGNLPPFEHPDHHDQHSGHEELHGGAGHEDHSQDGVAHADDLHHDQHGHGAHSAEHAVGHQQQGDMHDAHHGSSHDVSVLKGHHEESHVEHLESYHDQQAAEATKAEEHRQNEARLLAEVAEAQKLVTTKAPKVEAHTAVPVATAPNIPPATGIYAMSAKDENGQEVSLAKYMGKVTIVVNLASKCGYTKANYEGLTELYNTYHSRGVEIIGFPCNQFGSQEPGTCKEVQHFAADTYHARFSIYDKVEVNGPNTHPVYKYLKAHTPEGHGGGGDLQWNFAKWVVDKKGHPVVRYGSAFDRKPLVGWLEYELSRN